MPNKHGSWALPLARATQSHKPNIRPKQPWSNLAPVLYSTNNNPAGSDMLHGIRVSELRMHKDTVQTGISPGSPKSSKAWTLLWSFQKQGVVLQLPAPGALCLQAKSHFCYCKNGTLSSQSWKDGECGSRIKPFLHRPTINKELKPDL